MAQRGLEILREELWPAVRAGCSAADVHLMCSYPKCACRNMPAAVEAAIGAWEASQRIRTLVAEQQTRKT